MDIRTKLKELIHDMTDEQFEVFKYFGCQMKNAHTGAQSDTGKEYNISPPDSLYPTNINLSQINFK